MSPGAVLAGDAGATKTVLALCKVISGRANAILQKEYPSRSYPSLESVVNDFLLLAGVMPEVFCVGVPGPVEQGRCSATNIPWHIDSDLIAKHTGIPNVLVRNDLEVIGHSIGLLSGSDFECIHGNAMHVKEGNSVVIAPGTGLGQAVIAHCGNLTSVIPTEGGHADFAPQDELQYRLHRFLSAKFGHVSLERVLSGNGICSIYDFLIDDVDNSGNCGEVPVPEGEGKAGIISAKATAEESETCVKAMELFSSILGAHAGNMALSFNAKGGVFLAGGIPAKNIGFIRSSKFVSAYLGKGRLSGYVRECPVFVITAEYPGLIGAAKLAQEALL
ncbi:MAG: glucokinase [Ignavibacteria bacterium]|nr:glucokinase [Ignavibacteria bacterium]